MTPLCRLPGRVSTAIWWLEAGQISQAVRLSTTEEIWCVLAGGGYMWRRQNDHEEVLRLSSGVTLTVSLGTRFQFRAGDEGLEVFGVTVPPYPTGGVDEVQMVSGPWEPAPA